MQKGLADAYMQIIYKNLRGNPFRMTTEILKKHRVVLLKTSKCFSPTISMKCPDAQNADFPQPHHSRFNCLKTPFFARTDLKK